MVEIKRMDNKEKLSALFDGELDSLDIADTLEMLQSDQELQKAVSDFALIHSAMHQEDLKITALKPYKNSSKFNIWLTNGITAAASILITVLVLIQGNYSRMSENPQAEERLMAAINSAEAKSLIENSENNLVEHVLKVINDPSYMNSTGQNIDLRNVGFALQNDKGRIFRRGQENFTLRIEKKNLGLNKVRYWKHGNKHIYLVPLKDGRTLTLYGNLDQRTVQEILKNIK